MFCDKTFWTSKTGMALIGALLVGGVYVAAEHSAHLWAFLPYAFILACPLMHLFMHHGHGAHEGNENQPGQSSAPTMAKAASEVGHDT